MCIGTEEEVAVFNSVMDELSASIDSRNADTLSETISSIMTLGLNYPLMLVELAEKRGTTSTALWDEIQDIQEGCPSEPCPVHEHEEAYA